MSAKGASTAGGASLPPPGGILFSFSGTATDPAPLFATESARPKLGTAEKDRHVDANTEAQNMNANSIARLLQIIIIIILSQSCKLENQRNQ